MGLVLQGVFCSVIGAVPAHQGGFGDVVSPTDERKVFCFPINFHRVQFCFQKVWTIALFCGIIFHGD